MSPIERRRRKNRSGPAGCVVRHARYTVILSRYFHALLIAALATLVAVADEAAVPDFDALADRIAGTRAVGVFTKLSFKSDVDRLQADIARYHAGDGSLSLDELRQRYEVMSQKLLMLIQKKDPELARDIAAAHEPFWQTLADKQKFAQLGA